VIRRGKGQHQASKFELVINAETEQAAKAIAAGNTVHGMIGHRFKVRLPVLSCASIGWSWDFGYH